MKSQFVGLFLLIFFLENVAAEYLYICDKNLPINVCSQKNIIDGLFHINPCKSSTSICPLTFGDGNDYCEAKNSSFSLLPGEYCTLSGECWSGECLKNVCTSKAGPNEHCHSDNDCDIGFFCYFPDPLSTENSKCYPLLDQYSSQVCGITSYDMKCKPNLVCTNSKCVKPFSIPINSESSSPLACESFFNHWDPNINKSICTLGNNLVGISNNNTPSLCIKAKGCSYNLNYSSKIINLPTIPCGISYNQEGKTYCSPGRGDLIEDLNNLKQFYENEENTTCHISEGMFCNFYSRNDSSFYKAYVSYIKLLDYNTVYNNSDCINKTLHAKYYYAIQHSAIPSFSMNFQLKYLSFFMVFSLAFILL